MKKTFKIEAKSENLAGLRGDLQGLMSKASLETKTINEVSLAVDEALTNVIRHGYKNSEGVIEIEYQEYLDRIEILVRDRGELFNPLSLPTPELPPTKPGGLGVHFIRTLMDEVSYQVANQNINELRLVKKK